MRATRVRFGVLVLLLAGGLSARAAAETAEEAATAVLAAHGAEDEAALAALARRIDPDPWLVADELIRRGEFDAALAFAEAAEGPDVEALPDYVDGRRAADPEESERAALARANAALAGKDRDGAVVATDSPPEAPATVTEVRLWHARGLALRGVKRYAEAAAASRRSAGSARRIGWIRRAANLFREASECARAVAEPKLALECRQAALELADARGDRENARLDHEAAVALCLELGDETGAEVLERIADHCVSREDWSRAIEARERALELREELGDPKPLARTLFQLGWNCIDSREDYGRALSLFERCRGISEQIEDREGVAAALAGLGAAHQFIGNLARALSYFERSLEICEETRNRQMVKYVNSTVGFLHMALGDQVTAVACFKRSLKMHEEDEDAAAAAGAMRAIGAAYRRAGDLERARPWLERGLALAEQLEEPGNLGRAHSMMGQLLKDAGDTAGCVRHRRLAVEKLAAAGERESLASEMLRLAEAYVELGRKDDAFRTFERALLILKDLGARWNEGYAYLVRGKLEAQCGDSAAAAKSFDRAVRMGRRIRSSHLVLISLIELARVHLEADRPAQALAVARQGLLEVEQLLGGLAEGEGVSGRDKYSDLFALGALAAVRLDDAAAALEFLEYGRAGALLETLGAGRASRFAKMPEELVEEETAAKAAESRARKAHSRALEAGDEDAIDWAAAALDEAIRRRRNVIARMQRAGKRAAGVFYPRAAVLEEIQEEMPGHTALVLYGFCLDEALALVVSREEAKFVSLDPVETIETACAAVAGRLDAPGARGLGVGEGRVAAPASAEAELARLRSLVVEPLELGEGVEAVLVSPVGALGYVPWGALVDRPVTCVPSGTTWMLLRGEATGRGEKILALGAPNYDAPPGDAALETYRGGALHPLPATGPEAEAIGDRVLLGDAATESGLADALAAEKRWRAVHLACHGLLDTQRPLLSSLAVTPGDGEDGFLTCLDILGMEVPADLVVLSACETARGKVAKAEGIVGLTRAFMYAGSSCVLSSLWKVDDEATRALMEKFYELWNPKEGDGLSAAVALRQAQAFVRSREGWEHPRYWAAWVLWGMPD